MEIKQLSVFIDLASSLHFGRTAEKQNMTASTLSRMVQRLENEVGASLFERDNRSVSLTPAGQHYLGFARETLAAWDRFRQQLGNGRATLQGDVSLYCSVTASHSLLNRVLSCVREEYPAIDIRIHTGDQALSLQRLKEQQEDFVIAAKPQQLPNSVAFKRLSSSDLVFIAPNDDGGVSQQLRQILQAKKPSLDQLPWVLAEKGLSREWLERWFRRNKTKPNIYAQVTGHEAIVSMVALGCGVGFVPKLVLGSSPVSDKIKIIPDADLFSTRQFEPFELGLCVLRRRLQTPLIAAFWEAIAETD